MLDETLILKIIINHHTVLQSEVWVPCKLYFFDNMNDFNPKLNLKLSNCTFPFNVYKKVVSQTKLFHFIRTTLRLKQEWKSSKEISNIGKSTNVKYANVFRAT